LGSMGDERRSEKMGRGGGSESGGNNLEPAVSGSLTAGKTRGDVSSEMSNVLIEKMDKKGKPQPLNRQQNLHLEVVKKGCETGHIKFQFEGLQTRSKDFKGGAGTCTIEYYGSLLNYWLKGQEGMAASHYLIRL